VALLAHAICFGEPSSDFVIDFVNARKSKCVQMISRRESFDTAKARIFQAARQNHVAVYPVPPNNESCETHPDLKRDPRFLWQNRDRSVLLGYLQ